jgi:hypothetical protein
LPELVLDHDGRASARLTANGCHWGGPVQSRNSDA